MPIYLGSQPIGEVNVSFTSPDGGTNTNDASLQSGAQMLEGVTAYAKGQKITGTIPTKTESNLTATENIVNVPAGYYASACTKEVATADLPEPEATVDETGLVRVVSNLTSGGFLSAGQKANTLQLPVQAAKTVTPNSTEQVAVAAHKYTTGAVKVAAVPTETKKVTANGTYTPSSGKYFSSVEVAIAGDAPVYQDKTVTPTTTALTVTPDDGYDALSQVKVNAISVEQKSATPKAAAQEVTPSEGSYLTKVTVDAVPTETKVISTNGAHTPTSGKFFSQVFVNVQSAEPTLQAKTATPTSATQNIVADTGYDGLSKVTINPVPSETKSITENGTFTPSSGKWFSSVSVNVPTGSAAPTLQEKTVTPTKAAQEVVADEGYDGLSKVSISAIPNRYVDTSTATAVAADLNSGKTAYVNGSKITGTQVIQHYYTSTSMISNSTGNNGDIFLLIGGTT